MAKPKRLSQNPVSPGERFNRLTVQQIVGVSKRKRLFECLCDCGNKVIIAGSSLRSGNSGSCGCVNKEQVKKIARLQAGESSYNYLENRYKQNAKNKKRKYGLSTEQFRDLISQSCAYCGSSPNPWNPHFDKDGSRSKAFRNSTDEWAGQQWIYVNGIDRIDNSVGYEPNNCVACCSYCNDIKCDKPVKEFLQHIRKIVSFASFKETSNGKT